MLSPLAQKKILVPVIFKIFEPMSHIRFFHYFTSLQQSPRRTHQKKATTHCFLMTLETITSEKNTPMMGALEIQI